MTHTNEVTWIFSDHFYLSWILRTFAQYKYFKMNDSIFTLVLFLIMQHLWCFHRQKISVITIAIPYLKNNIWKKNLQK